LINLKTQYKKRKEIIKTAAFGGKLH